MMPSMTPGLGANTLLQPIVAFLGPVGSFSHQVSIYNNTVVVHALGLCVFQ